MSEEMSDGRRRIEGILRGVAPAAVGIARDEVMFAAGRASARERGRRDWLWQAGCGVMAAVCILVLAYWPATRVERVDVVKTVVKEAATARADEGAARMEVSPPTGNDLLAMRVRGLEGYLELRQAVLARGVDAVIRPAMGGSGGGGRMKGVEGMDALPTWQRKVFTE